jgi:hypothetical protein
MTTPKCSNRKVSSLVGRFQKLKFHLLADRRITILPPVKESNPKLSSKISVSLRA